MSWFSGGREKMSSKAMPVVGVVGENMFQPGGREGGARERGGRRGGVFLL